MSEEWKKKSHNKKLPIPPDKILAGWGSCLDNDKDSLIDDLHNIDSLIKGLYNKGLRIRDRHKKDSLIDGLHIIVVKISHERFLIVIQKGSSSS